MEANDSRHGTRRGYYAHRRAGQDACAACKRGAAGAQARYDLERIQGLSRRVAPHGTRRRLQGLNALGWTWTAIASELDLSTGAVQKMATEPKLFVYASTASKVAAFYDRASMTVPVGGMAERTRRAAVRHRYAPPLAWNEGSIDDPTAKPAMIRRHDHSRPRTLVDPVVVERVLAGDTGVTTSKAERTEVCRQWVESGRSLRSLEALTGWRTHTYYRPSDEQAVA